VLVPGGGSRSDTGRTRFVGGNAGRDDMPSKSKLSSSLKSPSEIYTGAEVLWEPYGPDTDIRRFSVRSITLWSGSLNGSELV